MQEDIEESVESGLHQMECGQLLRVHCLRQQHIEQRNCQHLVISSLELPRAHREPKDFFWEIYQAFLQLHECD